MMVFLPVMSCYVITDTFSGGSGFSLIGKLVAICFLGVGGAPVQINDGAALALVMLVIMVITMSVTGGFKNSENTRGTNL
jgi:ABC-type spermidine/putrescine transport system permease subunit I